MLQKFSHTYCVYAFSISLLTKIDCMVSTFCRATKDLNGQYFFFFKANLYEEPKIMSIFFSICVEHWDSLLSSDGTYNLRAWCYAIRLPITVAVPIYETKIKRDTIFNPHLHTYLLSWSVRP